MNQFKFKLSLWCIYFTKVNLIDNKLYFINNNFYINFYQLKVNLLNYIKITTKTKKILNKKNINNSINNSINNLLEFIMIVDNFKDLDNIYDQLIILLLTNHIYYHIILKKSIEKNIIKFLKPYKTFKIKLIYILLFNTDKIKFIFKTYNTTVFYSDKKLENKLLWEIYNL